MARLYEHTSEFVRAGNKKPAYHEFNTTQDLLELACVKKYACERKDFYQYAIEKTRTQSNLMAVYKKGYEWYVIGIIDDVKHVVLPKFEPKYKAGEKDTTIFYFKCGVCGEYLEVIEENGGVFVGPCVFCYINREKEIRIQIKKELFKNNRLYIVAPELYNNCMMLLKDKQSVKGEVYKKIARSISKIDQVPYQEFLKSLDKT